MKQNKETLAISVYSLFQFLILIIAMVACLLINSGTSADELSRSIKIIGWFTNIVFIIDITIMYRIKKNVLDFSIIFFAFFFLFCNGQIFLYTIGVEPAKMLIFRTSSLEEIYYAAKYFLLSMVLFALGSITPMVNKSEMNEVMEIDDPSLMASIADAGYILLLISIIPYMYIFGTKSLTSLIYGYSALYRNNTQVSGIIGYLSKLFIPSLLMLLYAKYENKTYKRIIHLILFFLAVVGLLSGNRGDGLSIIITLLIFRQLYGNEFTGRNIIKLIAITLVILLIIPVLFTFRGMTNRGVADFGNLFIESLTNNENNLVISSLSELGGTVYAFILTRRAVPSMEGFHYGLSYLASILMVIPSQLMGGFSFAKYAALDIWLQNIHHMGYGPGFSLTAETYYNFGWVGGILFSFVIGYFFTKMFNLRSKNKNKNEVLRLLSLIFLYNSIIVARFPFHNTVRNILYIYLIPYFLIMLLYNRKQKDRIKTNF